MRSNEGRPCIGLATAASLVLLGLPPGTLLAADYHVDSQTGDNARDGLTPNTAWRTLEKVNAAAFKPGDRVRFRAGSVWRGQLGVTAQGEPGRPIVFQAFGEGPRPRIDTAGAYEDAVVIRNAQHVEVRDFELTNRGDGDQPRRGVNVVADNCGTLTNLVVAGLFIHDVNGTQRRKDNGGIMFRTLGQRVPSRYDGLRIERNIIWRVDRSGIAAQSYHASRTRWFPSTNVVFRGNRYVGRHENRPEEGEKESAATPQPIEFADWPGPQFDPRQPEEFAAYLKAHREWMLRLMARQFGRQPELAR